MQCLSSNPGHLWGFISNINSHGNSKTFWTQISAHICVNLPAYRKWASLVPTDQWVISDCKWLFSNRQKHLNRQCKRATVCTSWFCELSIWAMSSAYCTSRTVVLWTMQCLKYKVVENERTEVYPVDEGRASGELGSSCGRAICVDHIQV